jgi:3-deoxy-D-manno-octulosonic-acid transferase
MIIYNILFLFGFVFFIPSLLWKLIFRGGRKKDFSERFGIFSGEKKELLKKFGGDVWIHSVSVGETQTALTLIWQWLEKDPKRRFVLSTTTTTAQSLAYKNLPPQTALIFSPLDFSPIVRAALKLIRPHLLVIFETEIWPAMICETRRRNSMVAFVNARISDKSNRGYGRFRGIFAKILSKTHLICAQSEEDAKRFLRISQNLPVHICGNMKFDQNIKEVSSDDIALDDYFGQVERLVILAASTHPREEVFITKAFQCLKKKHPEAKLVIVPRHAERGSSIAAELKNENISLAMRSKINSSSVDCLIADTTGELMKFIAKADIVIMGKSLAGHTEGHNLIEPAAMEKAIITGGKLSNFKFVLNVLLNKNALITVFDFEQLCAAMEKLADFPVLREKLGKLAREAVREHRGATDKTINLLEQLLSE